MQNHDLFFNINYERLNLHDSVQATETATNRALAEIIRLRGILNSIDAHTKDICHNLNIDISEFDGHPTEQWIAQVLVLLKNKAEKLEK